MLDLVAVSATTATAALRGHGMRHHRISLCAYLYLGHMSLRCGHELLRNTNRGEFCSNCAARSTSGRKPSTRQESVAPLHSSDGQQPQLSNPNSTTPTHSIISTHARALAAKKLNSRTPTPSKSKLSQVLWRPTTSTPDEHSSLLKGLTEWLLELQKNESLKAHELRGRKEVLVDDVLCGGA